MNAQKYFPWFFLVLFGVYFGLSFKIPMPGNGPDLANFSCLPALHNGRIKPLDTIARASLLLLRGKQTLMREGRQISATEWMLDVMARPAVADAYKVFVVNDPDVLGLMAKKQLQDKYFAFNDLKPFLSEVESQAAQVESLEPQSRSRYQAAIVNLQERLILYQRLKNTLQVEGSDNFFGEIGAYKQSIAPGMKALQSHQRSLNFDREALANLSYFFERYRFLSQAAYFHSLPPLEGDSPTHWINMGEGLLSAMQTGDIHPDILIYASFVKDYQSSRWGAFNLGLKEYGLWLKERFPKIASMARYEVAFNHAQPFYQGMILYLAVLLFSFLSWLLWRDVFRRCAFYLLLLGFGVHTVGLVSRIILQGRPPVTNLYSSAIFVGWAAVLLGIILERLYRKGFGNLVAAAVGFLTLIVAHNLTGQGDTMEMMRAVLDSNFWLATHVVTITIGYSSTFLAGALAYVYIFRGLFTTSLDQETSRSIHQMTYGIICFSLFFSFVGTILGGIWADQSWGRFWGWDPKENGALLIVLWNALILHARWGGYVKERGVMVMAVFGNIVTSLSWFGVNMLGIGLHSYGFMDKAFFWLSAFIFVQIAVMALGMLPPRYWRSSSA